MDIRWYISNLIRNDLRKAVLRALEFGRQFVLTMGESAADINSYRNRDCGIWNDTVSGKAILHSDESFPLDAILTIFFHNQDNRSDI